MNQNNKPSPPQPPPSDGYSLDIPTSRTLQEAPADLGSLSVMYAQNSHARRTPRFVLPIVTATIVLVVLLLAGFWLYRTIAAEQAALPEPTITRYATTLPDVPLAGIATNLQGDHLASLTINGNLSVTNTLSLRPISRPTTDTPSGSVGAGDSASTVARGTLYYDTTTNQPYYYDGSRYVSLSSDNTVTSFGGRKGDITLGAGLRLQGSSLVADTFSSPQDLVSTASPIFANPQFNSLTLTGSPLTSVSTDTAGLCLVSSGSTATPIFAACPGSGGISRLNGLHGDISITNTTATDATTLTLDTATATTSSTPRKGIAIFDGANFTDNGSGVIDTIQGISTASTPTFAGLNLLSALGISYGGTGATTQSGARTNLAAAQSGSNSDITTTNVLNTITPTNTLNIGASGHAFVLQGNSSSTLTATNSSNGFTTTLSFANPIANTILTLPALSAGTYGICTTTGNCVGLGGTITSPGGTSGKLARFSGPSTLVDSIVSESGTTANIAGSGIIQGASGTASLTLGTGTPSGTAGVLTFANTTNSNTLTLQAGATTSNLTFTLPVADGASGQCLSTTGTGVLAFSNCLNGTGTGGGVSSLNGIVGVLALSNATAAGSTITMNDATTTATTNQKGIAVFNGTNFTATNGTVNTIQDIATTSTPTFAGALLTGSAGLTVGTSTTLGLITLKDGNSSSYGTTLTTTPLTASRTISLPDASGTICLQGSGGCGFAAASGSSSYVQLAPAAAQVDNTTNSSIFINKTGASGNLVRLQSGGSDALTIDRNGAITTGSYAATLSVAGGAFQATNLGASILTSVVSNRYLTVGINGGTGFNTSSQVRGVSTQPTNSGNGDIMGMYSQPITGAAAGNLYSYYATLRQGAAATLTNGYHFYAAADAISAGGAITNDYGLYIESLKIAGVTTAYGIYQAGSADMNYLAGSLGLGTATPQASSLQIGNGWWIAATDSAGTGVINMFQATASNDIQVGAALNIDGGIIFPTDGGQLTMSDMAFSSSGVTAGTPASYTQRIGSANALTVYGENDGSGNAQNVRVAIGSSITPAYTLDVGGDINSTGAIRVNGTSRIDASGNLTVVAASFSGTVTFNGHIITGGSTPGITAGAAACTSPTVGVAGNDQAGTITITTGTGCSVNGVLATIGFVSSYTSSPRVVLTAGNAAAASLPIYRTAGVTQFAVATPGVPSSSTTYIYDYLVHQ